jgi:hypothetical protein
MQTAARQKLREGGRHLRAVAVSDFSGFSSFGLDREELKDSGPECPGVTAAARIWNAAWYVGWLVPVSAGGFESLLPQPKCPLIPLPDSEGDELKERTVEAIQRALEAGGIEFIDENGGGPGLRLKK